jgi:hypothetical protein
VDERIAKNGKTYNIFPVGPSICALPVVAVFSAVLEPNELFGAQETMEKVTACLIAALATALMYLVARAYLTQLGSMVMAFVFAYCAPV